MFFALFTSGNNSRSLLLDALWDIYHQERISALSRKIDEYNKNNNNIQISLKLRYLPNKRIT